MRLEPLVGNLKANMFKIIKNLKEGINPKTKMFSRKSVQI